MNFPDWWLKKNWQSNSLLPLSWLVALFIRLKKFFYKQGLIKSWQGPVPIIVVGNIMVGGTGKTPMVIHLANLLEKKGIKTGIVSKGYRGEHTKFNKLPLEVQTHYSTNIVGDEPLLMSQQTNAPVVIAHDRQKSIEYLIKNHRTQCIICDDGLQDYSIKHHITIAMIDGQRKMGNQRLIPSGPLREPISALNKVDYKVITGQFSDTTIQHDAQMWLCGDIAENLLSGEKKPLIEFAKAKPLAVAGIGNPERFFDDLRKIINPLQTKAFEDHHHYDNNDLPANQIVLMTSKDAIKCREIVSDNFWQVPVTAKISKEFDDKIINGVRVLIEEQKKDAH